MRLDLKIHDNSLKEMKRVSSISKLVSFILLNMDFFTIFARMFPIFLRVFPNFIVPTEGYLQIIYSNLRC